MCVFLYKQVLSCEQVVHYVVQAWKGVTFISKLLVLIFQLSCFTCYACSVILFSLSVAVQVRTAISLRLFGSYLAVLLESHVL